jgi:hypothetical protein
MMKDQAKCSYGVSVVAGDLYYEQMNKDEAFNRGFTFERNPDKMFKCQRDIEMFIEDNINVKMPHDGPTWRMYCQDYVNPEDGKKYIL